MSAEEKFRSGFVAIIGKPNVGKSTIMNKMIGQDISIVTPKAQTTRHKIRGIANGENYQLIFTDTPGILKPVYKLHERMMQFVESAFADTDVVLYVIEAGEKKIDDETILKLKSAKQPIVVAINKIDTSDHTKLEEKVTLLKEKLNPVAFLPISATENFGLNVLLKQLVNLLPESPPYFEKDALTDRNERFFATEIIREQILLSFKQEIPYSVEIAIEEFKDTKNLITIRADIYAARESQKAIILGNKGESIKKIGTQSRLKIEKMIGKKVFLELTVKIRENWRDDDVQLNRFGYGK